MIPKSSIVHDSRCLLVIRLPFVFVSFLNRVDCNMHDAKTQVLLSKPLLPSRNFLLKEWYFCVSALELILVHTLCSFRSKSWDVGTPFGILEAQKADLNHPSTTIKSKLNSTPCCLLTGHSTSSIKSTSDTCYFLNAPHWVLFFPSFFVELHKNMNIYNWSVAYNKQIFRCFPTYCVRPTTNRQKLII